MTELGFEVRDSASRAFLGSFFTTVSLKALINKHKHVLWLSVSDCNMVDATTAQACAARLTPSAESFIHVFIPLAHAHWVCTICFYDLPVTVSIREIIALSSFLKNIHICSSLFPSNRTQHRSELCNNRYSSHEHVLIILMFVIVLDDTRLPFIPTIRKISS